MEEERRRIAHESQNMGLPFLPFFLEACHVDAPAQQPASSSQCVASLQLWSQQKYYTIHALHCHSQMHHLEVSTEQWSVSLPFGHGVVGETSLSVAFKLSDAADGSGNGMARRIHAQAHTGLGEALIDISHGDVQDVFGQLRILLNDCRLAPSFAWRQAMSAREIDIALFQVLVGADFSSRAAHKSPSLIQIFTQRMKGKHEDC